MLVYQMGIQICDQVLIPRICPKVKLHHGVSLKFCLKEGKITLNVAKVGVHACYEMGIQIYDQISFPRNSSEGKLRRAFSLELGLKGVKSETP